MRAWLVDLLQCPGCRSDTGLTLAVERANGEDIVAGTLSCPSCARVYRIDAGIPRFVAPEQNYSENFGIQWRAFRTTQIDRLAGHSLSRDRLLADTGWPKDWFKGKLIFDGGAGAGRFSDVMAELGARVVACDLSSAVEACRETEYDPRDKARARGQIETVQASLLDLPFRPGTFDAIHCAGVIQHVSDPEQAMRAMPVLAKAGAPIFYNFYEIDPLSRYQVIKYLLRRVTPDWPMPRLFAFSRWLCRLLFVPSYIMSQIPKVRFFNRFLPICSVHPRGVPLRRQYEMTLLDTIDWYGPKYEIRQDHRKVGALLKLLGLTDVFTAPGTARAVKPATGAPVSSH